MDGGIGGQATSAATCRTRALTVASIALLAGLVVTRRSDLSAATGVLTASAPLPFLVAVGLCVAGVVNRAGQFRWAHHLAGVDTDLRSMLRVSAAGYALNKVVKTAGLGGVALVVRHGKRRGQPTASVLAACVVNSLSGQIGMLAVIVVALGVLTVGGPTSGTWTLVAGIAVLVLVAGLVAVVAVGLRSRAVAERWYPVPFAMAGRAAARFGLSGPAEPDPVHLDHFFEAVERVRRDPSSSLPVLAHAVAAKLIGAAVLAASLMAVGASMAPGTVLVVYVLALAAAATTILPGGLGAVEATMTLVLTGYGVPTTTALAATILFRLLDLWVPVLVGLVAAPGLDRRPIEGGEVRCQPGEPALAMRASSRS